MDVIVIGDLNPDLIISGIDKLPKLGAERVAENFTTVLGGSAGICAMALAKLGLEVGLISKVGDDYFGDLCIDFIKQQGVNTDGIIRTSNVRTGVTVSFSYPEDRALVTYLGANARLSFEDINLELALSAKHIHVAAYYLLDGFRDDVMTLVRMARQAHVTTSLDTGWDPLEQWNKNVLDAVQLVDIFFPNELEFFSITGHEVSQERVIKLGRAMSRDSALAVKLGSRGAMGYRNGQFVQLEPHKVTAVDSTGAGDTFDAGFIYSFLKGASLQEALRFANACGALAVTKIGGAVGLRSLAEVQAFAELHNSQTMSCLMKD